MHATNEPLQIFLISFAIDLGCVAPGAYALRFPVDIGGRCPLPVSSSWAGGSAGVFHTEIWGADGARGSSKAWRYDIRLLSSFAGRAIAGRHMVGQA